MKNPASANVVNCEIYDDSFEPAPHVVGTIPQLVPPRVSTNKCFLDDVLRGFRVAGHGASDPNQGGVHPRRVNQSLTATPRTQGLQALTLLRLMTTMNTYPRQAGRSFGIRFIISACIAFVAVSTALLAVLGLATSDDAARSDRFWGYLWVQAS